MRLASHVRTGRVNGRSGPGHRPVLRSPKGRALPGRAAIRGERGSLSVELVVMAPGLVLLLLLVAAGGKVVEVQGHIDGAARDAARAASIARSAGQAGQWALQAARADLRAGWCERGSVAASVTGYPVTAVPAGPGREVMVVVSCDVNMGPFSLLGFPAMKVFTSRAVAPLDEFVCRTGSCG